MRTFINYRGLFLAIILLLGFLPVSQSSAETRVQSDTTFRVLERDTATDEDAAVLPAYEYLRIDTGELEDYGVSFHLYGWGRVDLADSGYFEDQTDGELLYGYLEMRRAANRRSIRIGRQHVFEGVANEAIDGLRVSGDLGKHFSVSVYGGQPVGLSSEEGRSGDSIIGGRLASHNGNSYEIGVSAKTIENDSETAEDMMGVDLSLYLSKEKDLRLSGYSTYNNESEDWAEQSWELRVPVGGVVLKPYYRQFSYEDYFATGANAVNPFRVLAQSDEKLTAYGFDALWHYRSNWTIVGKVRQNDYDERDSSQVYSILADWQGEEATRYGVEVGRASTDETAGNGYTLVRLYGYGEKTAAKLHMDFVSADLLVASYEEDINSEGSSLFASLGGGRHFMGDKLSVKLSGDYSRDPYYDEDLRGTLTVSYNYAK